jgi:hypothetical protein
MHHLGEVTLKPVRETGSLLFLRGDFTVAGGIVFLAPTVWIGQSRRNTVFTLNGQALRRAGELGPIIGRGWRSSRLVLERRRGG